MKKIKHIIIATICILVVVFAFVVLNDPRRKQEQVITTFVNNLFTVTDFDKEVEYYSYGRNGKKYDDIVFNNFKPITTEAEFNHLLTTGKLYKYILGALTNNYVSRVVDINFSKPVLLDEEEKIYIVYTLVAVEVIYSRTMVKITDHIPCEFIIIDQNGFKIMDFVANDKDSFLIPNRR